MTLTVDDRELIERLRRTWPISTLSPHLGEKPVNPDGPAAADRLQSLLSDRDKLRETLRRIETGECVIDWSDNPQEEMQKEAEIALRSTDNG